MALNHSREMELVTWNYIRNNYEDKHNEQHVPVALKYLVSKFAKRIIDCKLLTIKQELTFFELLLTKIPKIRKLNLLYRASDNLYSAKKFHSLCDNTGPTITIIKSNHGNIFGGYTSKSWHSGNGFTIKDDNAFIFLITSNKQKIDRKCPIIFDIIPSNSGFAIYCDDDHGPTFGMGHDICIRYICNKPASHRNTRCYTLHDTYNYTQVEFDICCNPLCGDDSKEYKFIVTDYEVFNIQ